MNLYTCSSCGEPTNNSKFIGDIDVHICDSCHNRISVEVEYESQNEKYEKDTIICPHCDFEFDDCDCYDYEDGEHSAVECPVCEHLFDINIRTIRVYSTHKSVKKLYCKEANS